jgi:hypothetical protein
LKLIRRGNAEMTTCVLVNVQRIGFFAPWGWRPPPRAVFRCTRMSVRRIAAFIGVSPATVSLALQNELNTPIATRKKM